LADWPLEHVLAAKRELPDGSISVVVPALNEERTVGAIVSKIRHALMERTGLIDELIVIDSGSADRTAQVARAAGARVLTREDILPHVPVQSGKGEVLWRSLFASQGTYLCFIDADLEYFDPLVIPALLGPMLTDPVVRLVKASYDRPLAVPGATVGERGGRVTELVARPLINLLWPQAATIVQPLAGEYAATRSLLESLPFPVGYGVEFAVLIDTLLTLGIDAIAQVDIGRRIHSHQDDLALGRMAMEVMQAAWRRSPLRAHGEPHISAQMTQFIRHGDAFHTSVQAIHVDERPPAITIPAYAQTRKAAARQESRGRGPSVHEAPSADDHQRLVMAGGARHRSWLRVGLGADAPRWTTRGHTAKVLFVVHNVTSASRLLDIMPLFRDDLRITQFVTCTQSSPFQAGVDELFAQLELPVVPWEQAKSEEFDLIVSASYGGDISNLTGKVAFLSHGMGYNKLLREPGAGSREPGAGSREPGAGSREPGAGSREAFGMSAQWLLHDGVPIADFTILSHPEQLDRLRATCPEAAGTAVFGGDPCFDRMLEALPRRERFRSALGLEPWHKLVVLNSTWNPSALFGGEHDLLPWLLDALVGELPLDEYRVAAVLHPNIWHGHGPGQVRAWLDRAIKAGLLLVPPLESWRQTLVAADCVIGDHGSVTYYAAAIGLPVLLGAFPSSELDPDSPVAKFGRAADHLVLRAPLRAQIDAQIRDHRPGRFAQFAAWATSDPGASASLLRRCFYQALEVSEPELPAHLDALEPPLVSFAAPARPVRVLASSAHTADAAGTSVNILRYPEAAEDSEHFDAVHAHLSAREDGADSAALRRADLVLCYPDNPGRASAEWVTRAARAHPSASMVAACAVPGRALALVDGRYFTVRCGSHRRCDPTLLASALLAHLAMKSPSDPARAFGFEACTGHETHEVRVTSRTGPGVMSDER
jgi:hypothetical protein